MFFNFNLPDSSRYQITHKSLPWWGYTEISPANNLHCSKRRPEVWVLAPEEPSPAKCDGSGEGRPAPCPEIADHVVRYLWPLKTWKCVLFNEMVNSKSRVHSNKQKFPMEIFVYMIGYWFQVPKKSENFRCFAALHVLEVLILVCWKWLNALIERPKRPLGPFPRESLKYSN